MKKALSILMCVIFMLRSGAVFVWAGEKKGDPAELIAYTKELFSIGSDYDVFDYTYTSDAENSLSSYRFNWENTESSETVGVTIDDNKYISYYSKGETEHSGLGHVTAEEARASADSFLSLVIPEEYRENIVYEEGTSNNKYYLTYRCNVNGIPYAEDIFVVRVSKYTGQVTYYSAPDVCPFTLDYPEPEGIISAEEAHSLYKDQCGFVFEYLNSYDRQAEGYKLFPAYYTKSAASNMIDAFTGESTVSENYDIREAENASYAAADLTEEAAAEEDEGYGLSEAEIASIDDKADILPAEEALAIVEAEIPLPDKTNLRSELEKREDEYLWSITIDSGDQHIYMLISADTGELLVYSDYAGLRKSDTAPNYDTMHETAERLAAALSNGKYRKTELEYNEYTFENGEIYGFEFNFIRVENAVKFRHDYISIGFDASGRLDSYLTVWSKNILELPDTDGAIGLEAAYDKLYEISAPILAYIKTDEGVRLVYAFGYDEICLDKYGNRINPYDGTPYTEEEAFSGYTDIEGSRYENIIKQLLNNGYYIEREEFKPEEPITTEDFAAFFKLTGKETERGYVFNRIPDKFYGETLTRYEAAEILASLKVDAKILSSEEIYSKELYKDEISPEYLPCAAVCYILGYMKGDNNGLFNGSRVVTNGEAAVILYNYLTA